MTRSDWVAIFLFFVVLLGWIFASDIFGMGTIAILGAVLFLVAGLVKWEDINSGVNWGVVLLYGAAISLGIEMKETDCGRMGCTVIFITIGAIWGKRWLWSLGCCFGLNNSGDKYDVKWRGSCCSWAYCPENGNRCR